MARIREGVTPYDLALADMGLSAPGKPNAYVRNPWTGGLTPVEPSWLQPIAEPPRRGTSRSAGPQQPFDVGNVRYNPNFYNTALGRRELEAEQRAGAERQLRDLRFEAERQGQIVQSGAQVFTPEERQRRQEVSQSLLSELDYITPFVRSGAIGPGEVQGVVGSAITGGVTDLRDQRKAQREMQAIIRGGENGTLNETQMGGAVDSWVQEHGLAMAAQIPEAAKFLGIGEQIKQAQNQRIEEHAKQKGLPADMYSWNNEKNKPTIDPDAVREYSIKAEIEEQQTETLAKVSDDKRKRAEAIINARSGEIKALSALISASKKSGQADPALVSQLDQLVAAQRRTYATLAGIPDIATAAQTQPSRSGFKTFSSRDEATAALRAGQIANNAIVLVGGVPAKNVNGQFRAVGE